MEKYNNLDKVIKWTDIYEGNVGWLDDGTPFGNKDLVNFGAVLVSKLAQLSLLEFESRIEGEDETIDIINESYQAFLKGFRANFEVLLVQGGGIIKPRLEDIMTQEGVKSELVIEYVPAAQFIPRRFDNRGELVEISFIDVIKKGKDYYTRLETHNYRGGMYSIVNEAYKGNFYTEELKKQVSLGSVEEWADIQSRVEILGLSGPLYVYMKTPYANNTDILSPIGVSVFNTIEKVLMDAEVMYERIQWEYEATEIAVDASQDFFINRFGNNELMSRRMRVFRALDTEDKSFYKVYSPDIRDENLFHGMNQTLRRIESNVGLAYGTLSEVAAVEKTAEEVKAGRETTYITVKELQNVISNGLERLIEIAVELMQIEIGKEIDGDYELFIHYDDSVIVDRQADLMYQEVKDGIINKETYIMRRYGVSKEEAIEMMG